MQEDFKKYFQSRMSSNERQEFESLMEQDSKVKADYELYRQAHFAIETQIAEDLRRKLRGEVSEKDVSRKSPLFKWASLGFSIILLLAALWTLRQSKQFSDARFHRYVQVEDQLLLRGGQNQDFLRDFKEAYDTADEEEMIEIIAAHKGHIQSTNMSLLLAEHYWHSGKNDDANALYETVHQYDPKKAGRNIPVGKSHLNQAYFFLKTGQKEKFQRLISALADPENEYELQEEAAELLALSKKPLARLFM